MKPSKQPEPAPVAPAVDSNPFEALLAKEHKPSATPVKSDFEALLDKPSSPVSVPAMTPPKTTVLVWVEKEIVMQINRCAVCGKVRCPCPNRELINIKKTVRYQVEQ